MAYVSCRRSCAPERTVPVSMYGNLSSGVYFYSIQAGDFQAVRYTDATSQKPAMKKVHASIYCAIERQLAISRSAGTQLTFEWRLCTGWRFSKYAADATPIVKAIFLPTSTVVAQTGNTENASERIGGDVILGAYASSRGLISKLPDLCVPYCEPIDPIPYSGFHGSIRYDSYQTVFFFAKDKNEFMFHFTGRYNFHLIEEKLKIQFFPFLGLSIWFFDRKFPIQGKYPIKSESGGYCSMKSKWIVLMEYR